MRLLCCVLYCFFAIAASGCIYIPTPQHDLLYGRGMIDPEMTQRFQIGITTRDDVLLLLGEPDATLTNQSIFLYTWTRTQGYMIVYGARDWAPVGRTTILLFEFDANNYVKRFERSSPGFFSSPLEEAQRWASEGNPADILWMEKP